VVSIDIVSLVVTGVVAALASFFGSLVMWSLIGPRVVKKGIGRELGPAMITWLFEPSIKTGEKAVEKRERADGTVVEKEVDEIVAPAEELARRMGRIVYHMMLGKLGGDGAKKAALMGDVQAALANPDNPLAQYLGAVNPKIIDRALKDGDYIPLIIQMFLTNPQAREWVSGKVKSVASATNAQAKGGTSSAWLPK